jgi:hypothetical protein
MGRSAQEEMNTQILNEVAGVVFLGLFSLVGLIFLACGVLWIHLLSYRVTSSHLQLLFAGIPVRRVQLSDIAGAERRDARARTGLGCLWSNLVQVLQPWKQGGVIASERWGNSVCGPFVIVRCRQGRSLALTPTNPDQFIRDLLAATGQRGV